MEHVFETDAYFKAVAKQHSATMFVLREMIFDIFPDVRETLQGEIPTYIYKGRILCSLASRTNYMEIFIKPYDLLLEFEEELENYYWEKNCIRFSKIKEADFFLFEKLICFAGNNYKLSKEYSDRINIPVPTLEENIEIGI